MKKLLILIITILCIFISSQSKVQSTSSDIPITLDNLNKEMLSKVNFTYLDLDLTSEEVSVIEKYQTAELLIGLYNIDSYYHTVDGNKIGQNIHIYNQLGKVFNLNTTIVEGDFYDIQEKLKDGEVDVLLNYVKTHEREQYANYSDTYTSPQVYFYSNEYTNITTIQDFHGLRIGTRKGTELISHDFVDGLLDRGIEVEIVEYEDLQDACNDLGELIDVIVSPLQKDLISDGLHFYEISDMISSYETYHVSTKSKDELRHLLSAFDKAYMYGLKENLGLYNEHYIQALFKYGYFFSDAENEFILQTQTNPIIVKTGHGWKPYVAYNESDELEGYAVEVFSELSALIGINYSIESDQSYTMPDMYSEFENDRTTTSADMGIITGVSPKYNDFLTYSIPIHTEDMVVYGLSDSQKLGKIYDLMNYEIGVISYYAPTEYIQYHLPNKDLQYFNSNDEILEALRSGLIDYTAFVESEYNVLYYSQKNYDIGIKYVMDERFSVAIPFPTNGENTEMLLGIYNKAITITDFTEKQAEYFSLQTDLTEVVSKQLLTRTIIVSLTSLIVILVLAYLYRRAAHIKSLHDPLTGVLNRRGLFLNKSKVLAGYLYFIDLDDFKNVNDNYGHYVGDLVLQSVVNVLREKFSDIDCYRIGGDEFLITSKIYIKGDELLEAVSMEREYQGYKISISVSIGIVHALEFPNYSMDEILNLADHTMFVVKSKGKNNFIVATKEFAMKLNRTSKSKTSHFRSHKSRNVQ